MQSRFILQGIVALAPVVLTGAALAEMAYTTVAATGSVALGTGGTYRELGLPLLNDRGEVAFHASIADTGTPDDWGIWTGSLTSPQLIMRQHDKAPGVGGDVELGSNRTSILAWTHSGKLLVRTGLTGNDSAASDWAIWFGTAGSLQLVARRGDVAPGTGGQGQFKDVQYATMNSTGLIALNAELVGSGIHSLDSQGVWAGQTGSLALVARTGNSVPGTPAGTVFSPVQPGEPDVAFGHVSVNDRGMIAMRGYVSGANPSLGNDAAAWAGSPNALQMIGRQRQQAGGLPPGTRYGRIDAVLSPSGPLAVHAELINEDSQEPTAYAIWTGQPGNLRLALRSGDHAPGTAPSVTFRMIDSVRINSSGHIAFHGSAAQPGSEQPLQEGIWSGTPGKLRMVAGATTPVPGSGPEVNFASFLFPLLNDLGQVAFVARTTGLDIGQENDEGIWATDPQGNLMLVAHEGQWIDLGDGDWRIIRGLSYGDQALSNTAQLAFRARFDDGSSAIIVANVPEPSCLGVLALAAGALLPRRNRLWHR